MFKVFPAIDIKDGKCVRLNKGDFSELKFYNEVFNASNLLGIFTGHIHKNSIEIINGKPQIVSDDNASGGYLDIDFLNLKQKVL